MASSSAVRRATPAQSASAIVADVVEGSHVLKIPGLRDSATATASNLPRSTWGAMAGASVTTLMEMAQRMLVGVVKGWGYARCIERKALEESSYPKNDCFSVRCDVAVSMEIRAEAARSQQFVNVPPSNLHHHLGCLLSSNHGADVTFEVAGETVAAHRYILAARSSVFKAEISSPMKEKSMTHIRIDDDIDAKVFRAMLHFVYTDSLPPEIESSDDDVSVMMAQHLLVVADRYDLERLKLICEGKLCDSMDASMAATTLALAEQHGCRGLKEACFEFLKSRKNLKATMESGFDHLMRSCPSLIKELLAKGAACP